MENTQTETKMKKSGKKVLKIVLASIGGAIALAALVIFLGIPGIKRIIAADAIKKNDYIKAYDTLSQIEWFFGSDKKADSIYPKYLVQKLKTAAVGDTFTLGTYEQDGFKNTGAEDIEWVLLAVEDNKALVLSKYVLDCAAFNSEFASASWETCTLRRWLNEDFLGSAFAEDENSIIATTTVSADKNPMFGTDPGADTQDKIFLLSVNEAEKYCPDLALRKCEPTEQALRNNVETDVETNLCKWWLRSPGLIPADATAVGTSGHIYGQGNYVFFQFYGVRPAMWIDLSE